MPGAPPPHVLACRVVPRSPLGLRGCTRSLVAARTPSSLNLSIVRTIRAYSLACARPTNPILTVERTLNQLAVSAFAPPKQGVSNAMTMNTCKGSCALIHSYFYFWWPFSHPVGLWCTFTLLVVWCCQKNPWEVSVWGIVGLALLDVWQCSWIPFQFISAKTPRKRKRAVKLVLRPEYKSTL